MTQYTAKEIVTRAARNINYIGVGEELSGDEYKEAIEEYKGFHEWLRNKFNPPWNYDAVDERYWTHVAGWFTSRLVEVLPASASAKERAAVGSATSEQRLREMMHKRRHKTVKMPIV